MSAIPHIPPTEAAPREPANASGSYARLAVLFDYPSGRLFADAFFVRRELAESHPEAAEELGHFVAWLLNEPAEAIEETYTRTFYISPVCVPYVSVHLFGDESFHRGDLMAKLRDAYNRIGFDAGTELPDHVAVLLRFARHLDGEELDDLARYVLIEPVRKMAEVIGRTANPYRHVLRALELALEAAHGTGGQEGGQS